MGNIYGVDGISGDIVTIGSITAGGGIISTSTTEGFLPPQLTTTQRNAIPTPATGLEIFNTTTNQLEFWNGSAWASVGTTYAAGTGITLTGTTFSLTVPVTIALGGTNSSTALSNGKIIASVSGSIVESSISTSNVFLADGTVSATGAFSLGNNQVHNVTDPTSAQDAATKNYVDNAVNGLDWKQAALLATTTALPTYTYSSGVITMVATGTVSVDGSVLALGNRILVKNETSTNQPYNGIYNVTTAGAVGVACVLTRSTDYNSVADIQPGDAVYIQTGTVNATTSWVQTQTITSVGGVGQNIIFVQSSGPGTIVINGTTNQIIASTVGNTTTLSTPQSISTSSTVQFAKVGVGMVASNTLDVTGTFGITATASTGSGTVMVNVTNTGVLQLGNSTTGDTLELNNQSKIGFQDAAQANVVGLFAPTTLSGSYDLILPLAQGAASTFLKNNGTGSLSFSSVVLTTDVSGTLPVANGGTGDTSFTAYSVITGGTTSTGALQSVSGVGTAGQILTSNGASALPTWQNSVGGVGFREDYIVGTALNNYTGSTTVFNLVNAYNVGGHTLIVTLDGDVQTLGSSADYLETNSTTVTFNNALVVGERVSFIFSQPPSAPSGTVNSGTTGQIAYYATGGTTVSGNTITASNLFLADGSVNATGNFNLNSHKITGLAAATTAGDGISYGQSSWSLAAGSLTGALAMGSNKITGLANGTASTDAMAFGQFFGPFQAAVQVIDTTNTTTSSSTFQSTALAATIVPTSASHRIKITVTAAFSVDNIATSVASTIVRGAVNLGGTHGLAWSSSTAAGSGGLISMSYTYIDSPATTSSTTYTMQILSIDNTNNVEYAPGTSVKNVIILEEIA